ncbi:MAG: c-type cytochrome biogenesis protein CcmI [Hyphomicrobiales bacterium]
MELENAPLFFWVLAGLLTLAAIASALWPMVRKQNDEHLNAEANEGTRLVLIDQLEEIKRDRDRGLINEDEEASARAELGRRLLALDRETPPSPNTIKAGRREIYPWLMILLIPLATVGFYSLSGGGNQPTVQATSGASGPAAEAGNPSVPDIKTLVAQVEAHLANNPDDVRGWQTIAPVYQRQGKLDKAEEAFRKALSIGADDKSITGVMQNGLGQVLTQKEQGIVGDEALTLFRQAQINEPRDATGFFFEAIALSQDQKRSEAISAWEVLIDRFGQQNPPWLEVAEQTLASLKAEAVAEETTSDETKGPTAEDVEEISNFNEEDRNELIASMVDGLAARLESDPNNLSGWLQLIRSYIVLERKNDAASALKKARETFKDNAQSISKLDEIAQQNDL